MTLIEAIATLFGVLCVWLTIRQNILCWPAGLIQVFLYVFVFYRVRLYSDMMLHVIYIIMQLYGWYHWQTSRTRETALPVTTMQRKDLLMCSAIILFGTAFWGSGMQVFTDASAVYADAFVAVTSLAAQFLMARKKLESWIFWVIVDIVAIAVYLYKDLVLTAGLYGLFLCMALAGYVQWRSSAKDFSPATMAGAD